MASASSSRLVPEPARSNAFPIRSLLERLGGGEAKPPWVGYLPAGACEELRAMELRAEGSLTRPMDIGPFQVAGRVWTLSQDARGCREIQRALEDAETDEKREAIADELRSHIRELAKNPHGNHVVQRCIVTLRTPAIRFVIDELMHPGCLMQIAKHKYGCRIVQRLVEHCEEGQMRELIAALVADFPTLANQQYSNFVISHLLEHGPEEVRKRLMQMINHDVLPLAAHPHGCAVLGAALERGQPEQSRALAERVLKERALLVNMACSRHGHVAVKRILEVLLGDQRSEACSLLRAEADFLQESKYGRLVVAAVETLDL